MIQTTEGIVLKTLTFRESDQIVTLLTPRMGKVAGPLWQKESQEIWIRLAAF